MGRRSGKQLTAKETKFVKGLSEGLSQAEAARRAGYSEQMSTKKAYQLLQRPLVRTAFTDALERAGLTWEKIVKPVMDGLNATIHLEDPRRQRLIDTGIPDLKIRQQAHDRAVALYGGIPKTGEAVPTAHGLNLFIAVDSRHQTPVGPPPIAPLPRERSAASSAAPPVQPAPARPPQMRIGIQVEHSLANRQGPKPNGGKSNGTS